MATVPLCTNGMSAGSTTSASPSASAMPACSDENIPRDGSGLTTGHTRGSLNAFTSRFSSSASGGTTTMIWSTPPFSSAAIVRSSSGSPSIGTRSFFPPNRSALPAAGTMATVRI